MPLPGYPIGQVRVLRVLTSFDEPFPKRSSFLAAIRDDAFLLEALRRGGRPGCLAKYRTSIAWFATAIEAGDLDPATKVHSAIRELAVQQADYWAKPLRPNDVRLGVISDLLLFGQSQGLLPRRNWLSDELKEAKAFGEKMVAEGMRPEGAQRYLSHVLHWIAWARLEGIDRVCAQASDHDQFADHNCRCGMGFPFGTTVFVNRERRLALLRWERYLAGKPILSDEHGIIRNHRKKRSLPPSVERFERHMKDHRGFVPQTVKQYIDDLLRWHPRLGEDASSYDARTIRDISNDEFARRSPGRQSRFLAVLRGYIRFRASRGECDPALLGAIISRPAFSG